MIHLEFMLIYIRNQLKSKAGDQDNVEISSDDRRRRGPNSPITERFHTIATDEF